MSIRDRLLLWLLSALLVASTLITAATYIVERIAIRDSENSRLQQIALAIPGHLKKADLRQINVKLHHGPDDFLLQIWDGDGTLIYQSHPDLTLPSFSTLGFSTANWGGERWKVYMRKSDTNTIQVAQSLDARKRRVNRHALRAIIPPLLVIPLFGLFIPLCLNRGLQSLAQLSKELETRSPQTLGPLSAGPQPAEIVPLKSALDSLLQRLSQASDMQRTFIADASHELRTPLATLQVQTQLVEQALGTGHERPSSCWWLLASKPTAVSSPATGCHWMGWPGRSPWKWCRLPPRGASISGSSARRRRRLPVVNTNFASSYAI